VNATPVMGPDGGPSRSVGAVIVNFNGGELLLSCVASLREQPAINDIVVIDNGSVDGSLDPLWEASDVRIIQSEENLGFGLAANQAAAVVGCDVLLFLNPDVVLRAGCVDSLLAQLKRQPGIAGPVLEVEASRVHHYGATINRLGMPTGLSEPSSPLYVPGCALAIDRHVFTSLGGFDKRYFLYMEDTELCWQALRAGYEVSVALDAHAWHQGGQVAKGGYTLRGARYVTSEHRVFFRERHGLSMLLACSPVRWLPYTIPFVLTRICLEAVWSAATGHRVLAGQLIAGIWWNVRQLPATLARRRSVPAGPAGTRTAASRVTRSWLFARTLSSHGVPRVLPGG
jgi:N-acetylglucosaminyl-diphospho-decaprenol L-rhamnosyltransferase